MKDSLAVQDRDASRRGQSYALPIQEMQTRACMRGRQWDGTYVRVRVCAHSAVGDIKDTIKVLDTRMKEPDMKYKFLIDLLVSILLTY